MGYYIAKNIKIDKNNNKISGVVADSNWRDFKNHYIYDKVEDFYSQYNTIGDKIATLYYDIICGNIHTSISKYTDLVCSFEYFKDFLDKYREINRKEDRKDNELYMLFLEYENKFKEYTTKNCVLKRKQKYLGSIDLYIKRVNKRTISQTQDKEKAKLFNDLMVKNNDWLSENYDIEYI